MTNKELRLTKEEFKRLLFEKLELYTKEKEVNNTIISILHELVNQILEEYKEDEIILSSERNIDLMLESIEPLLRSHVS